MMEFRQLIVIWYVKNKRDLPWRNTNNPYEIWISEVILQQTRVIQGIDYYYEFIKRFPTNKDLALSNEDEVLKLWQGLGYYSRARNLHAAAKYIHFELKEKFPATYEQLIQLRGVGEYTAAAILSFAYNKPYPIVDGNVFRVLSRVFGISTSIDSSQGKKEFYQIAKECLDKEEPAIYNQAVMELGALQCIPRNPKCIECPLVAICYAYKYNKVEQLPVKGKKMKQRHRHFNYMVIRYKKHIFIKKRDKQDIWKGLYEFPLIETSKPSTNVALLSTEQWRALFEGLNYTITTISKTYKHILTHQVLHARFWEVQLHEKAPPSLIMQEYIMIGKEEWNKYAVPKLIERYVKDRIGSIV